jgi:hypothetical protein
LHPKERLLGLVYLYRKRGDPIPLDLLAEADQLGLSLELLGEPTIRNTATEEGVLHNHGNEEETDI